MAGEAPRASKALAVKLVTTLLVMLTTRGFSWRIRQISAKTAAARDMYAPAYPLIARQIVDRTGITEGNCLDIGTGCGYLGIALAKITALRVRLFDIAPQALCRAAQNAAEAGLSGRLETLQGDVQHIPLPENSIDLAVSRASMMFWPDMADLLVADLKRCLAYFAKNPVTHSLGEKEAGGYSHA